MTKADEKTFYLKLDDIYEYLKNRPPILMIDEAYVEPGVKSYTSKILGSDEWYFAGHFPGNPMMPGCLQLETLFNTSALAIKLLQGYKDKTTNVAKITSANFKRHILPKEKIDVFTEIQKFKRGIASVKGVIKVGGEICLDAEFVLVVLEDVLSVEKNG